VLCDVTSKIPADLLCWKRGEIVMLSGLFSPMHLIVILVIVLIVFGPGKLPELGNSLGKSIKNFKKSMEEPDQTGESDKEMKKIDHDK
jgi:sec-independent protein translocase protein TatA